MKAGVATYIILQPYHSFPLLGLQTIRAQTTWELSATQIVIPEAIVLTFSLWWIIMTHWCLN